MHPAVPFVGCECCLCSLNLLPHLLLQPEELFVEFPDIISNPADLDRQVLILLQCDMAGGLVGALMWLLVMNDFTDRVGEGVEITNKTFNCILHA